MSNGWVEFFGKTVDDAICEALVTFETVSDNLDVEIVEKESSGFLGLIGKHGAKIRAKLKEEIKKDLEEAEEIIKNIENEIIEESDGISDETVNRLVNKIEKFLLDLFNTINLKVEVSIDFDKKEKEMLIDISSDEVGILIGKRGQTLDSLQYIISLVANKGEEGYIKIKLDSENYRERRKETLENLAKNIAMKVKRTGSQVVLEPMNSFERRIIHSSLQDNPDCETFSEGNDPYRRVVVRPKGERKNRYNRAYTNRKYKKPYRNNRDK